MHSGPVYGVESGEMPSISESQAGRRGVSEHSAASQPVETRHLKGPRIQNDWRGKQEALPTWLFVTPRRRHDELLHCDTPHMLFLKRIERTGTSDSVTDQQTAPIGSEEGRTSLTSPSDN